jgi:hypothetical protein
MIQQVITCDICGSQKRQANHWFIACAESGELRIRGWDSAHLRPIGTKHVCGETCAHKLVSQFLMTLVNVETQRAADKNDITCAAEARVARQTDCERSRLSRWDASPIGTSLPEPSESLPRGPQRLHRQPPYSSRKSS